MYRVKGAMGDRRRFTDMFQANSDKGGQIGSVENLKI
jgi:hypothetical protein